MPQPAPSKSATALLLFKLAISTICVPCTLTIWAPLYWIFPEFRHSITQNSSLLVLGAILIVLGACGYMWCALEFAFRGHGTPFPADPPKVLVARGLYRFVRNPMYVSVLTVLVGECVVFASWKFLAYAAIVGVGFHLFVMIYEEPTLRRKMGPAYVEYCREVRRWIPRLTPRRVNDAV